MRFDRLISPQLFYGLICIPSILALADSPIRAQELQVEITRAVTCERSTRQGDTIKVHYRGTLESDGTEFDNSYLLGNPFEFTLGAHEVITGWDKGLQDMCIGEGRRLIIPPEFGYGARPVEGIPASSTLIFETELIEIEGVGRVTAVSKGPEGVSQVNVTEAAKSPPTSDGECRLLGPFALLVQGALGALALLSLVFKRWRETPQRPLKIWAFDASKQVVGSILLHLANLFMSMLSSGDFDVAAKTKEVAQGQQPNPCSFYLLNLAIDTTIGIPILVVLLRLLHHGFLLTPLARPPQSIKSGNYGQPPSWSWWAKQCLIYFLGLIGMKLCVFLIFKLLPWISWIGDWALRWTEGNEAIQISFVMFIFPLIMNAMQYYIIDGFIKDTGEEPEHTNYQEVQGEDDYQGDESDSRQSSSWDDDNHYEHDIYEGHGDRSVKEVDPNRNIEI